MSTPEEMRKAVLEQKEKVTSRISDLSRYVGFGLVAVAYSILTSDDKTTAHALYASHTTAIVLAAALGVLTILLDYVQFLAGYYAVEEALKNVEGDYRYESKSFWYRIRNTAFGAKQATAIAGALIFGWTLLVPLMCRTT